MRLIDADELLQTVSIKSVFGNEINKMKCGELRTILEMIKNAPTVEPQRMNGRWISVTEALPRDDEEVIVTCLDDSGDTPYSYTTVAWHYKGMWVCDNTRCLFVTAWMPLPDPYKGGTR